MSCDSCIYTCSTRGATSPPPQPCPNADVSGIGVVTGYTVNAGIVVVIILLNYIFAFEPDADPFLLEERGAQPRAEFLPNPIDKLVVAFIREKCRIHVIVSKSVKEALKKCVLSMSDLQILTGISILISGFKQLRCGISNYHWSILVYLAWFSSLTHFGCLTFLRNYLFNHPGERAWRLFFMAVIVVMLMVALYPTGQADDFWNPSDAVICLYKHSRSENSDPTPFINMIISMILLGFGFFIRIVKLFQILSTSASNKIRNPFSKVECWALSRVYNWSSIHQHPTGWKRLLVYRPLLAWALLFRIGIDLYLSMLGEVLWMAISFAWGLVHLLRVRRSAHGGENDWSFGQVVPVILIAAPLLTVFEFFYPDGQKPSLQSTSTSITPAPLPAAVPSVITRTNSGVPGTLSTPIDKIGDSPDHNFYQASTWFKIFAVIPIVVVLEFSAYALMLADEEGSVFFDDTISNLDFRVTVWTWAFLYCPCYGVSYILLALLFEHHNGTNARMPFLPLIFMWLRVMLVVSLIFFITITSPMIYQSEYFFHNFDLFYVTYSWLPVVIYVALYFVAASCTITISYMF